MMSTWKISFIYMFISAAIILFLQIATTLPADATEEMRAEMAKVIIIRDYLPILFSIGLCGYYWKQMMKDVKQHKLGESIYPTLMAAQGTFYTFLGISIILLLFTNRDVTQLIGGLKLAFFTSAIGIMLSIVAKIYLKSETESYVNQDSEGVVVEDTVFVDENDFYRLLKKIHETMEKQRQDITQSVKDSLENYDKNTEIKIKVLFDSLLGNINRTHEILMTDIGNDLKEINSAMTELKNNAKDTNEGFKVTVTHCEDLNKYLQKLKGRTEKFADNLIVNMDRITVNIDNLCDSTQKLDFSMYAKSVKEMVDGFITEIVTYNNILKKLDCEINNSQIDYVASFDRYQNALDNLSDNINVTMQSFATDVKNAIQSNVAVANEAANVYRDASSNYQQYIDAYNSSMKSLIKANDVQAKNIVELQNNYKRMFDTHINMMNNSIDAYAGKLEMLANGFISNSNEIAISLNADNEALQRFGNSLVLDTDRLGDMLSSINKCVIDTQKSIEILGQALLLGRETLQNTTEDYGMFVSALMSMKMAADENITLMNKLNRVLSDIVNTGSESGEIITKSRYTINLNKD